MIFERRSRRWVFWGLNIALGLLATCAAGPGCSGNPPPAPPPPAFPSPGGGGEAPGAPCAEASDGPALPRAFALSCGGCHGAHGEPTGGFPDLFAFADQVKNVEPRHRALCGAEDVCEAEASLVRVPRAKRRRSEVALGCTFEESDDERQDVESSVCAGPDPLGHMATFSRLSAPPPSARTRLSRRRASRGPAHGPCTSGLW